MTGRKKFPLWGAFFTLIGVCILCTLGFWQLQRLEWKTGLLDRLEAEYRKDALAHTYAFKDLEEIGNQDIPLVKGSVKGRFNYDKEIFLGPKTHDGTPGFHVLTPLKLEQGGWVIVNRGFTAIKDLPEGQPQGTVQVGGIFRKPDWNTFTSGNSPENDLWFRPDLQEIAQTKDLYQTAPVMLYAEEASADFPGVEMTATRWQPRNKHRQYAIFWFTMAGILVLIFGVFALKRPEDA